MINKFVVHGVTAVNKTALTVKIREIDNLYIYDLFSIRCHFVERLCKPKQYDHFQKIRCLLELVVQVLPAPTGFAAWYELIISSCRPQVG